MEKKYQVFISSTYKDLIEERKKALEACLLVDCIPAGMEAFTAANDNQFNVIKKVIDLCDLYVLIVGGRYGSVIPEKGISYTEAEYDYAMSKNIPVLTFIIDDIKKLPDDKVDTDEICKSKLLLFKERLTSNRLVSFYSGCDDLYAKIIASIANAKTSYNLLGWTRGSNVNIDEILKENYDLKKENEELKEQIESDLKVSPGIALDYENKIFEMHYTETCYVISSYSNLKEKDITPTLGELFKKVSQTLTSERTLQQFYDSIDNYVPGFHTSQNTHEALKAKFLIIGLIQERTEIDKKGYQHIYVSLTDLGFEEMKRLNS